MKTCQFIGVSDSFLRETILIQWQYYTAASSHFPDRANQATKTARNVTKNATGYDVDIFSHLPTLQPVLSTFPPPVNITFTVIQHSLPHTQFYSPVTLLSCCPRYVSVIILFYLSRSFSDGYLGDFKLKFSVHL